ncbi:hypothetical protein Tco_1055482 [Tanacetum coccineum]|uniref:ABC transmembrane type-1 domain-containing protein n=1 Tax=Tanacetum coccineum TaxID=301880 RepID=A0ABQ5GZS4_9ASTR
MWIILVVSRLVWRKERDVANLKTKRWNCGACKQLVGEGCESSWCLYAWLVFKMGQIKKKCTLPIEGMRSIISTVSISLKGFLPSILLLVMIIVAVVIVAVILVVVVVAIVRVVIVVMIIGVFVIVMIIRVVVVVVVGVSFILKLSFMIISFLHRIAL